MHLVHFELENGHWGNNFGYLFTYSTDDIFIFGVVIYYNARSTSGHCNTAVAIARVYQFTSGHHLGFFQEGSYRICKHKIFYLK